MKKITNYILIATLLLFCVFSALACGGTEEDAPTEGLEYTLINNDTAYEVSKGIANTNGKVIIPSSYNDKPVISIANGGFVECSGLTSITIPNSVANIGRRAFENCNGLTNITIPDSVKTIKEYAFTGCISLTSLTIGKGLTDIGFQAFAGISQSLNSINVSNENSIFKSENNCLIYIDIEDIKYKALILGCKNSVIPDYVSHIGDYAFSGTDITTITLPESVTNIGTGAFSGCTNLQNITIPVNVTNIGIYAFYDCINLQNITIPDSVTNIGTYAFYGCIYLKSITIPDSVTDLGYYVFEDCMSLTIYSETESPMTNWGSDWNFSSQPVVWGCTLSADKTYVVSFTKYEENIENPDEKNIKAPYRQGYTFSEWNTNEDGTGTAVAAADITTAENGTILYAIWAQT